MRAGCDYTILVQIQIPPISDVANVNQLIIRCPSWVNDTYIITPCHL